MTFQFEFYRKDEDDGYEHARHTSVWNGRVPERYPDVVCLPETDDHIITAVKYAKEHSLKVGIRSGGHSWTAAFLRDEGMLIDLSKMTALVVDAPKRTACVQPGIHGGNLNLALQPHGLMFPSGHCPTVALGGYLLQGGFGCNSRVWGLACENVLGLDVVTADGELVHASPQENEDLYWAARGAGPGFFSVVTRFHLRLQVLPTSMMSSLYWVPGVHLEELLLDLERTQDELPRCLELSLFIARDQGPVNGISTLVVADTYGTSKEEALASLNLLDGLSSISKTAHHSKFIEHTLEDILKRNASIQNMSGSRYHVDNMWTDRPVQELLPAIHKIVDDIPPHPAHLYVFFWGPIQPLPDMAFSMQSKLWFSYYIIHSDPALDTGYSELVATRMRGMEHLGPGIQLGDENLIDRPAKFMATENFRRLQCIREKYDPDDRFHTYFNVPKEFQALIDVGREH